MARSASIKRRPSFPQEWSQWLAVEHADFEYIPLRLPPDVTRVTAAMRLAIEAEFGGWEVFTVRLYTDGTRKVLLKRRRTRSERHAIEQGRELEHNHTQSTKGVGAS